MVPPPPPGVPPDPTLPDAFKLVFVTGFGGFEAFDEFMGRGSAAKNSSNGVALVVSYEVAEFAAEIIDGEVGNAFEFEESAGPEVINALDHLRFESHLAL